MPRYITQIWVEHTSNTLTTIEIEAPSLELAQQFAQNPNEHACEVSIEEWIEDHQIEYGDTTGYYSSANAAVEPVVPEPTRRLLKKRSIE